MKLGKTLKVAIAAAAVIGALATPKAPNANAAITPHCVYHNYVYGVGGGCDGLGGPGHDRMDISCRADNTAFWFNWYGKWHSRYGSWQESRSCGGGWFSWKVWFEHKNS
jgi:hypothetical protein